MSARPLGRITPPDFDHVTAKPLRELEGEAPTDVAVTVGINWYDTFDSPKETRSAEEGTSWHLPDVAKGEPLGTIRGGHCVCLEPMGAVKLNRESLRVFYNQQQEGACVGFGHARAQSILRGYKLFDAFWLYDEARKTEGTYPEGEGSTCRAACQVLETIGLREQTGQAFCQREVGDGPVDPALGIKAVRWATTVDEVLRALARPNAQAVPFTNNWGDGYPLTVWMPVATLDRLLKEGGEADVVTER
jgi:hypothetical protein